MSSQLKLQEPQSKTSAAFGHRSLPGILLLGILLLGVMLAITVALVAKTHANAAGSPGASIHLALLPQ